MTQFFSPSDSFCSRDNICASFCCLSASSPLPQKSTLKSAIMESMICFQQQAQSCKLCISSNTTNKRTYYLTYVIYFPVHSLLFDSFVWTCVKNVFPPACRNKCNKIIYLTINLNTPGSSWNLAATQSISSYWCSPNRVWIYGNISE